MAAGRMIRDAREKKGWSQARLGQEVAALLGLPKPIKQQSIDAIEQGRTLKSRYQNEIFQVLELGEPLSFRPVQNSAVTNAQVTDYRNGALPVHAATEGGRGSMVLSTDPIAYVSLPDLIAKPEDGYGIIVVGTSMMREFNPGDTALVHKKLPPVPGEACVFYADDGHGAVVATIKTFLKATHTHWHVEQSNPKRKFTLLRKDWQTCHRVVGKYSRR
jgi:phage repressor protein C with HTH and peptisase S24 domain